MINFLGRLSPSERKALLALSQTRRYPKGGQIYAPLGSEQIVFLVEQGTVQLYDLSFEGKKVILATLGTDNLFGDLCTYDPPCAWVTNFAEAKPGTVLRVLTTQQFLAALQRSPRLALRVIEDITHQLRTAETKIKGLTLSNAAARLIGELVRYARDHGQESDCCLEIRQRLTHQEMAEMAALARETTTSLLSQLRQQGVIGFGPHRELVIYKDKVPRTF